MSNTLETILRFTFSKAKMLPNAPNNLRVYNNAPTFLANLPKIYNRPFTNSLNKEKDLRI